VTTAEQLKLLYPYCAFVLGYSILAQ